MEKELKKKDISSEDLVYWRKEKEMLRKDKEQLRNKEEQLRKEKEQLRKEKEQLRNKEERLSIIKGNGEVKGLQYSHPSLSSAPTCC